MPEVMDDERPVTLITPLRSQRERRCNALNHIPVNTGDHTCSTYEQRWAVWKVIVLLPDEDESETYFVCNKGALVILEQALKDMREASV